MKLFLFAFTIPFLAENISMDCVEKSEILDLNGNDFQDLQHLSLYWN